MKKGWDIKTLGDLFEITSSKRVFKEDWKTEGVPFYRAREIVRLAENGFVNNELFISEEMFKEYSEKYGLPKDGDIMVTGVGTLGICYVVKSDDKFYFKDGNIIWLKSNGKANSRYVEYAFKSEFLRKQIDDSVGATVGTYTIIKAKSTKIPLPPLPEQQRIVSILDEAFAVIERSQNNAEQNLKNTKELFESYLQGVFEKKGEGWEEKNLGDVANTNGRIGWKGLTAKEYTEKGPLFLSVHSLNYGDYVDFRDAFHISQERYDESPEIMLQKDDILICKDGAGIGKLGIIPDLPDVATINSSLLLIRCKKQIITKYLYYNLLSPVFQSIVYSRLSGATTPHLYQRDIVTFPIQLPPLLQQQTIVRQLDALRAETQKLEAVYQQKIDDLEELKKSILQKAFAGELKTEKEITV